MFSRQFDLPHAVTYESGIGFLEFDRAGVARDKTRPQGCWGRSTAKVQCDRPAIGDAILRKRTFHASRGAHPEHLAAIGPSTPRDVTSPPELPGTKVDCFR